MRCTWLGQAGLLFDFNGTTVMVDPYLSNSCFLKNPSFVRRFPVNADFLKIRPDVLILTHNHLDHTDPETLAKLFENPGSSLVLASENAWQQVRKFGGRNNYVQFNAGTSWTHGSLHFRAVYAEHSDNKAIGVMITAEGKNYYITGDTLYNEKVIESVHGAVDYIFLPINGVGNNMNATDAALLANRLCAGQAVPLHFGLFDQIDPESFPFENKIVPRPYLPVLAE